MTKVGEPQPNPYAEEDAKAGVVYETMVPPGLVETINHPAHYGGDTKYEAIKLIIDWRLGFCGGNALKYIIRAPRKGTYGECLRKALWYLDYAIKIDEYGGSLGLETINPYDAAKFWFEKSDEGLLAGAIVDIANWDWERARRKVLNTLGR